MNRLPPIPDETRALQARASDPASSVWVSANAGSGKTHVLAQRVMRLLLGGTDPSKILCLTYTRAAAANMANRVFDSLARWAMLDEAALAAELAAIEGRPPGADTLARARRLFARALETPGGLKIQTVHAFCEALLHQFPLEANIAGHFEMLDPQMEAALVSEARRDMIGGAAGAADPDLAEAFAGVLERGGEFGLDALLSEIVAKRDRLRSFLDQCRMSDPPFADLFSQFDFGEGDDLKSIVASVWPDPSFSEQFCHAFVARAAAAEKSTAENFGRDLLDAFEIQDPVSLMAALSKAFLVKKGGEGLRPRSVKGIATKGVAEFFPGFADEFVRMAAAIRDAGDRVATFRMLEGTRSALVIADWLIGRYEHLKSARGFLDFNDLINRTVRLLARQDVGPWVQYKLDQGIDHILIDEAQDTSPEQWQVVRHLAAEFFAGSGAREGVERTLFAVGDEKQSIYSFQGADPASFAASGTEFAGRVHAAGGRFEKVGLTWSFRSTEDVLAAVDLVFARPEMRDGLSHDRDMIGHRAIRAGSPGYVELWPMLGADPVAEPEDWREAIDHARAPSVRLAENVAATIAGWLHRGETVEGTGRRVGAGDILVLVRRRDRFVHALSRALKRHGVAVAGADRLSLSAHIAVKDLTALGRFLLQPEDDLSLAAVLKSPIFGETDERLVELATGRAEEVSLYASLREKAERDLFFADTAAQLAAWIDEAAFKPVFEFYGAVLGRDGVRRRMVARLGQDAGDIIDEFLGFCLAEERAGLPGLQAFLASLDMAAPEIKREMDQTRNEVRIMTVHAAKGLEAPVVFLVDGGSEPFSHQHLPKLMPFQPSDERWQGDGFLWRYAGDVANGFSQKVALEARRRAEAEYRRLLYVGMTRAEDRLIVCGYYGKRKPSDTTWHATIDKALAESASTAESVNEDTGETVRRFRVTAAGQAPLGAAEDVRPEPSSAPPAWLLTKVAEEPVLPRPLSPSRAGAAVIEDEDEDRTVSRQSPVLDKDPTDSFAIRRGLATHRLLQMLPGLLPANRAGAAKRYLARFAADWSEDERQSVWGAVETVLADTAFAPIFADRSRAEVSVMGSIEVRGEPRVVSGKIDRVAVTADRVLLVDFKASRPAPAGTADVSPIHLVQMALYRALMQPLYPGRRVDAALLYTDVARLIELRAADMDAALARLTDS